MGEGGAYDLEEEEEPFFSSIFQSESEFSSISYRRRFDRDFRISIEKSRRTHSTH